MAATAPDSTSTFKTGRLGKREGEAPVFSDPLIGKADVIPEDPMKFSLYLID